MQKNVGITFVFVTHDQEEALSMSDRIAVMSGGKVLQIAAPRALYEAPNCREVADFIGQMNFFDAQDRPPRRRGRPDRCRTDGHDAYWRRTRWPVHPFCSRCDRKRSFCPRRVREQVKGAVTAAAYLGERSHYNVAVAGLAEPVSVAAQNTGKFVTSGHAPGDVVYLSGRRKRL